MHQNKADVLAYLADNAIEANYIGSLLDTDKTRTVGNMMEMLISIQPNHLRIHYLSIEDFGEMYNDPSQYRVLDMWFDALALKYGKPMLLHPDAIFEADEPMYEENKDILLERYGHERADDGSYHAYVRQQESFVQALARYFEQLPPNRFLEIVMTKNNLLREDDDPSPAINWWGATFEYMLREGFNASFSYKPKKRGDTDDHHLS